MDVAVSVEDVSKRFRVYHERNQSLKIAVMRGGRARYEEFWALSDVDLSISHGETFGLVGPNGSGKSTLLKCLARILVPDKGRIATAGRLAALLELGAGFHAELSGRDNVYLNGSILGLTKRDIDSRFDEIVSFAGLEQFIDTPVKNYSSGMYVRLGFSVAINVEPDILLVDEVLAVGDEEFQHRSMEKFRAFRDQGRTVVVVSHALGTMRDMCNQVAWLDHGRVLDIGKPDAVIDQYAGNVMEAPGHSPERTGSGELRIQEVVALPGRKAAGELVTGSGVRFRLEWEAATPVLDAAIELTIRTMDGMALGSLSSDCEGRGRPITAGQGSVEVTVPTLPLAAGTYFLDATVTSGSEKRVVDHLRNAGEIVVHPAGLENHPGPVVFGGKWADLRVR